MTTEWIFSGITRTVEDPCSWLWRHIVSDCDVTFVGATVHLLRWTPYMYASSPLKNRAWGAALSFCSDLTLSQEFQPMAAQLSIKAALPLAKIQVRQLYVIVVRQGPAWLVCVMSNATRLGGTVSGGTLGVRALAHGIAAPGFMPPAPAQSPPTPTPTPTPLPLLSLFFWVNPRHKFTPPRPSDPRPRHFFS